MNDKRQLLCTFSTPTSFEKTTDEIKNFYKVFDNSKFFVFSNEKNPKEMFVTYNIISTEDNSKNRFKNTIGIHRKKLTNTLYTLNAMNRLIQDENGGVFDNKYAVDWELYKNSLILTGEISIRIIPLKIHVILN
jgi:hypothetical protein